MNKLILSHTHECTTCNEAYECFCETAELLKLCIECSRQLLLIDLDETEL